MAKVIARLASCVLASHLADAASDDTSLLQARSLMQVRCGQGTNRTCTLPGSYCVVSGDPHVKPFDEGGEKESCLGPMGDYYLVKTSELWIQARYMGFKRDGGYSFVRGLVMGGARLGGKKFNMPIINSGAVEFDGVPIPSDGYENHALGLRIWHHEGPRIVGFEAKNIVDTTWKNTWWIELKKDGLVDILMVINQGTEQHIMISSTPAALKGTEGHCGNYNNDGTDDTLAVDDCPGRIPPETCEFPVCPNPEDGEPRVPTECTLGTKQFDFYTGICKAYYANEIKTHEWKLWNCVTDCCGNRDSCPDLTDGGLDGTCLVKGDPHIKTFDSPTIHKHVYAPLNDYWLVNSKFVQVQVRYGTIRWDGKAQVLGVVVGGILTGGVTVYIPAGENPTQIDGAAMSGSEYDTPAFQIIYERSGENFRFKLDSKKASKPTQLYTLTFKNPSDGKTIGSLMVNKNKNANRYKAQTVFFRVENWVLEGVSGQCGNFNGNPDDDDANINLDIVVGGSMFPDTNPDIGKVFNQKDCSHKQAKAAKQCCVNKHSPATLDTINSCIVDHCCGDDKSCDPLTRCDIN